MKFQKNAFFLKIEKFYNLIMHYGHRLAYGPNKSNEKFIINNGKWGTAQIEPFMCTLYDRVGMALSAHVFVDNQYVGITKTCPPYRIMCKVDMVWPENEEP